MNESTLITRYTFSLQVFAVYCNSLLWHCFWFVVIIKNLLISEAGVFHLHLYLMYFVLFHCYIEVNMFSFFFVFLFQIIYWTTFMNFALIDFFFVAPPMILQQIPQQFMKKTKQLAPRAWICCLFLLKSTQDQNSTWRLKFTGVTTVKLKVIMDYYLFLYYFVVKNATEKN